MLELDARGDITGYQPLGTKLGTRQRTTGNGILLVPQILRLGAQDVSYGLTTAYVLNCLNPCKHGWGFGNTTDVACHDV